MILEDAIDSTAVVRKGTSLDYSSNHVKASVASAPMMYQQGSRTNHSTQEIYRMILLLNVWHSLRGTLQHGGCNAGRDTPGL